jgi:hypothetical protein
MYRVLRAPSPLTPTASDNPPSIPTPEEGGWLDWCYMIAVVVLILGFLGCCIGLILFNSSLIYPTPGMVSDCADLLWANRVHVTVHMLSLLWIGAVCYLFVRSRPRDAVYGWSVAVTVVCVGFVVFYGLLMRMLSAQIDLAGPNSACVRAMGVGSDMRQRTDLVDHANLLIVLDILCIVGYALGIFSGFVRVCIRCLQRGDGGKAAP